MMWKDFFYYSKSERRAVYVLLVLIVALASALVFLPDDSSLPLSKVSVADSLEIRQFVEQKPMAKANGKQTETSLNLSEFDPNTADSLTLSRLGLPSFVIRNVLKYRQKGGRFSTPESFSRIYGLPEKQYQTLKPYIRISDVFVKKMQLPDTVEREVKAARKDTFKVYKYPEGTLVDVAKADTSELKKIPGIGSGIARAIVSYRNRLGGFYDLSQLGEIEHIRITPEVMKWFKLEEVAINKLRINSASLECLRAHPYLDFYQAKVIVEYRKKKGEIKSLSQLSLYEEFTEKDLKRLAVYISFD